MRHPPANLADRNGDVGIFKRPEWKRRGISIKRRMAVECMPVVQFRWNEKGCGMKKVAVCVVAAVLFYLLTACTGQASPASPTQGANESVSTVPVHLAPTASGTPTVLSPSPSSAAPATPTLAPDAWQSLPIVPVVDANTRRIYAVGQNLGNNPHGLSLVGDCLSLPINLFGNYGKDPSHYNLGDYTSLQPVIDWFVDSFNRQSITLGDGFNSAAVLSPLRADPKQCQNGETPLVCEYRIYHPSYALIALGTDDIKTSPEIYEQRMRQIVEYTISQGIVPILETKADNREGNNTFNKIIARLAYDYDVPLWNFWAAVQPLAKHGVANDRGHLTWADPNHFEYTHSMEVAVPVHALTALRTLDSLWRGLTGS
jgi:hypothetical protein